MPMQPLPPNGMMNPRKLQVPPQFPPPNNMFGMLKMMPPPVPPHGMNMNLGSPQFPNMVQQINANNNNSNNNNSNSSSNIGKPPLRRSQSTPTKSTRASQLQAIQKQIEMLEAHLKEITPGKKKKVKLQRAQSNPETNSPLTVNNSDSIVVGDDEEKVRWRWFNNNVVREINLDAKKEDDNSPQALRRRKAAAAALRRLSSNEQQS